MVLGEFIDDDNISRNCGCDFRCCICGGWCASNGICTRCENVCIDRCEDCDRRCDRCGRRGYRSDCGDRCGRRGYRGDCGCRGRRGDLAVDCVVEGDWDRLGECDRGRRRAGTISIRKLDALNRTLPLAGAGFELQDRDGMVVANGYTNEEGRLHFRFLPEGTYFLRETAAPVGYVLDTASVPVILTPRERHANLEVTNTPIATPVAPPISPCVGSVTAVAVNMNNSAIAFPNISLQLVNNATGSAVTATTGANGSTTFSNVPCGTYSILPIASPPGYTSPGVPTPVTVSPGMLNPSVSVGFIPIM
jgi:hypothetical protein